MFEDLVLKELFDDDSLVDWDEEATASAQQPHNLNKSDESFCRYWTPLKFLDEVRHFMRPHHIFYCEFVA